MVITWLMNNDKETDDKLSIFLQNIEIMDLFVFASKKISHKKVSELQENVLLSAVGNEICCYNDEEKKSI